MIRVMLPSHLRMHARHQWRSDPAVEGVVTQRSLLDALEAQYPVLRGTVRDYATQRRRPFLRFFACQRDLSLDAPDTPLPETVVSGAQPFLIVAAIAGG